MTTPAGGPRVGPNAVLQTAQALREEGGEALAARVFEVAGLGGLLAEPPAEMVPEEVAARLHRAVAEALPPEVAERVAREAGRLTGEYILAHRIPRPAQWLLRALPPGPAARLLLGAIARHAWTFAGSGAFRAEPGRPAAVEIAQNPLATPGCPWHRAVFARLFAELVSPRVRVGPPACATCPGCGAPGAACRFEIAF